MTFKSEDDYKEHLEKHFFPDFFDNDWTPVYNETKEVWIRQKTLQYGQKARDRIDYFGYKKNIPTYVEVKNERIRQKNLLQIVRYYCQANEENPQFNFYVICKHKIRPHREFVLGKLNIIILDENDTNSEELHTWM